MITVEQNVVINRPVDEVFAYVSNVENMDQWAAEIVEVKKTSDGPVGAGTTFTGVVRVPGRWMENEHEINEHDPNSRFRMRIISGPVTGEMGMGFDSVNHGTKVSMAVEVETG